MITSEVILNLSSICSFNERFIGRQFRPLVGTYTKMSHALLSHSTWHEQAFEQSTPLSHAPSPVHAATHGPIPHSTTPAHELRPEQVAPHCCDAWHSMPLSQLSLPSQSTLHDDVPQSTALAQLLSPLH